MPLRSNALLLISHRYVLSATHLHEFKSPDRISSQTPVMSLPLADQKLGSHSNQDSTSHKFMLKGRQSGAMHKSHAWVFRAESYDTMIAWFGDIKSLTETTGPARDAFIRRTHARSVSGGSHTAGSISDGSALDEDEADQVPYSATTSHAEPSTEKLPQRPKPGGRFPSLLSVNRDSQIPLSPSSPSDNSDDREVVAAAGALPGSGIPFGPSGQQVKSGDDEINAERGELGGATPAPLHEDTYSTINTNYEVGGSLQQSRGEYINAPVQAQGVGSDGPGFVAYSQQPALQQVERHDSTYGSWMASVAAGTVSMSSGTADTGPLERRQDQRNPQQEEQAGLQAVEMAAPVTTQEEMTNRALAAAQSSTLNPINPTNVPEAANDIAPGGEGNLSVAAAHAADPAGPIKDLADRPPLESHKSVASVSQLHIPGEFPKTKTVTDTV